MEGNSLQDEPLFEWALGLFPEIGWPSLEALKALSVAPFGRHPCGKAGFTIGFAAVGRLACGMAGRTTGFGAGLAAGLGTELVFAGAG